MVGEIIAKLGLRYRPSGEADLSAHAQRLALLAEDLSDVPAPLLDEAAKRWARESPFLPKASDLREASRKIQGERHRGTDSGLQQLEDHCDRLNAMKGDKEWYVVGDKPNRTIANRTRRVVA